MQAKTKFQKQVMALSQGLRAITEKQKAWAIESCIGKYAVISRKTTFCLECGHHWKEGIELAHLTKTTKCPKCQTNLKYHDNHRITKDSEYFAILTTKKGIQVVRVFLVTKYFQKKQPFDNSISEVMQHWINCDGKMQTLAKPVNNMSYYCDQWIVGNLEPRTQSYAHQSRIAICPYKIYPHRGILPQLKRNGFKGHFHSLSPQSFFHTLLSSTQAETLLKAQQFKLFKACSQNPEKIDKYWKSICICIRNKYLIEDVAIWIDTMDLLKHFNMDLHSPKYVCAADLKALHDTLVARKNRIRSENERKEKAERDAAFQETYEKTKGHFFSLSFKDYNLSIVPLRSIHEFFEEGQSLHHCIYSNEYFNKEDSLVFSAKIDGKPTETVEVSLSRLEVVQSRGLQNKATQHHERIISLVEQNIHQIKNLIAS